MLASQAAAAIDRELRAGGSPLAVPESELPRPKHPGGRPTLWRDEFLELVKSYMAKGFSLSAFAGEIGVSFEAVDHWTRTKPEFLQAVKEAKQARINGLERKALLDKKISTARANIVMRALEVANPNDWNNKLIIENKSDRSENPLTQVFASLVQSAGGAVGEVSAFAGVRFEAPRESSAEPSVEPSVEQTVTIEAQSTSVEPSAD